MAKKFVDIDNLKLVWDEINNKFVRNSQFWEKLEVLKGSTFPSTTYNGKISLTPDGEWSSDDKNLNEHEQFRNDFLEFINSDNINKFIKVSSSSEENDKLYEVINRTFYNEYLGLFEGVILNSLGEDYDQSESSDRVHYWYLRSIYSEGKYRIEWQPYIGYILTKEDMTEMFDELDNKISALEDKLNKTILYSINALDGINGYDNEYDKNRTSLWDKINNLSGELAKLSQRLDNAIINGGNTSNSNKIQKEYIFSFYETDESGKKSPIRVSKIGSQTPDSNSVSGNDNEVYVKYTLNAYNFPIVDTDKDSMDKYIKDNVLVVGRGSNIGVKTLFDNSLISDNVNDISLYYEVSFEIFVYSGGKWRNQYDITHSVDMNEDGMYELRHNSSTTIYNVHAEKIERDNPYLFNAYQINLYIDDNILKEEFNSSLADSGIYVHVYQARNINIELSPSNYNNGDEFNYLGSIGQNGLLDITSDQLKTKVDSNKYWSNRLYYVASSDASQNSSNWVTTYDIGYVDVNNNYDDNIVFDEYVCYMPYKKIDLSSIRDINNIVTINGVEQEHSIYNYDIEQLYQYPDDNGILSYEWRRCAQVENGAANIENTTDGIAIFNAKFNCGDVNVSAYCHGVDNDRISFDFQLPPNTIINAVDVLVEDGDIDLIDENFNILEEMDTVNTKVSNIKQLSSELTVTNRSGVISAKLYVDTSEYEELENVNIGEPTWLMGGKQISDNNILGKTAEYNESLKKYIYTLDVLGSNNNISARLQYSLGNGYEYQMNKTWNS
jgi:hypothetical protein